MNCLFCSIVEGKIPASKVYENDSVIAFDDINPQAPTHVLVIPKTHYENAAELAANDAQTLGELFAVAHKVAGERSLSDIELFSIPALTLDRQFFTLTFIS